ncbi:MAG: ADOP family duplicated permease [Terriglobales bacterium]
MGRWFFRRSRAERELADELEFHLERSAEREGGRGRAEARLGGSEAIKEECREQWAWARLAELGRDARGGLRGLRRSPGFALVAILALGLAIGANTAIFSALDSLALRPLLLPFPAAGRIVRVVSTDPGGAINLKNPIWAGDYAAFRDHSSAFSALAGWTGDARNFAMPGVAAHADVKQVTGTFFPVFQAQAWRGRLFAPGEDQDGHEREAVLSYGFWHAVLAGRPVVGRPATLDGEAYTVIGILPQGWAQGRPAFNADIWVPLTISPAQLARDRRTALPLALVGRLRPGETVGAAAAAVEGVARRHGGAEQGWGETVVTLRRYRALDGDSGSLITLLLGLSGVLLLIACGSVGGLLLERGAARAQEMAVRRALGASRGRLLRQLLAESAMLAVAAGAAGLGLGWVMMGWIQTNMEGVQLRLDPVVLAFTAAAAVATVLLVGLGPAWHASRGGGTQARLRRGLVAAEVALALVALAAGFAMVGQVQRDLNQPLGYQPRGMLSADLTLAGPAYRTPAARAAWLVRLQRKAAALPGATGAALVSPPGMAWDQPTVVPQGSTAQAAANGGMPRVLAISPGYFRVLEATLESGRVFTATDQAQAAPVAVVDQTAAVRFFGGVAAALGKTVKIEREGEPTERVIVGVVADLAQYSGDQGPVTIYEPLAQRPQAQVGILLRSAKPKAAGTLAPALRQAVAQLDAALPLYEVETFDRVAFRNVNGERALELMLVAFDALAIALAAIGLYGVVAYAAERRRRELAIRMALGAGRGAAVRLLVAGGLRPALAGLGVGLGLAWLDSYALAHMFAGVATRGWLLLGGPAALLAAVCLLASYLPARRAVRREPMAVLKQL